MSDELDEVMREQRSMILELDERLREREAWIEQQTADMLDMQGRVHDLEYQIKVLVGKVEHVMVSSWMLGIIP